MNIVATKQVNEITVELHVYGWPGHWLWSLVEVEQDGTRTQLGRRTWSTTKRQAEVLGRRALRSHH